MRLLHLLTFRQRATFEAPAPLPTAVQRLQLAVTRAEALHWTPRWGLAGKVRPDRVYLDFRCRNRHSLVSFTGAFGHRGGKVVLDGHFQPHWGLRALAFGFPFVGFWIGLGVRLRQNVPLSVPVFWVGAMLVVAVLILKLSAREFPYLDQTDRA
jgi:hypothetical protein